ncbi:MAG: MFS transporter [Sphingomonas sp.]|jgi:AAHS family 4-hydroxybenzoate transporter-like MFS transporter|uniref:MFS transporter n=1 Tax=Sphingomonas sp. TaxID=28214 RepID=UPI003562AD48
MRPSVDIDALMDGRMPARQKLVLGLGALAIVFDGFDNQLLGFAAPAIMADWHLSATSLVPVVAFSLIAMTVGTALGGYLADRVGRRPMLIGCVFLFGIATLAIAAAPDFTTLIALRITAGLGLGGALPVAAAYLTEFTSKRHRSMVVSLGIVCTPLGGLIAGALSAVILPSMGWRHLFLAGGLLSVGTAMMFLLLLPESPRYLLARGGHDRRINTLLRRFGHAIDADAHVVCTEAEAPAKPGLTQIFSAQGIGQTLLLWSAFFCCLLAVYAMFSWGPTILNGGGVGLRVASIGLALFNLGGMLGALVVGVAMDRLGSRRPMLAFAAAASIVSAIAALYWSYPDRSATGFMVIFAILGLTIAGLQVALYALATQIYPTAMRASGVGFAAAIGRLGAIASSAAGALSLANGASIFFVILAVAMAGAGVALASMRHHFSATARP